MWTTDPDRSPMWLHLTQRCVTQQLRIADHIDQACSMDELHRMHDHALKDHEDPDPEALATTSRDLRRANRAAGTSEAQTTPDPKATTTTEPSTSEKKKEEKLNWKNEDGAIDEKKVRSWMGSLEQDVEEAKMTIPKLKSLGNLNKAKKRLADVSAETLQEHVWRLATYDRSTCFHVAIYDNYEICKIVVWILF